MTQLGWLLLQSTPPTPFLELISLLPVPSSGSRLTPLISYPSPTALPFWATSPRQGVPSTFQTRKLDPSVAAPHTHTHRIIAHQVPMCPHSRPQLLSISMILASLYFLGKVLGCKHRTLMAFPRGWLESQAQQLGRTGPQPEPQPKSHLRARPGRTTVELTVRLHCP